MTDWLLPFVTALAAGVLSSWGVGGGTLLLVAMTLLLGVEQLEAQAINILFFLPHRRGGSLLPPKNGLLDRQVWRQTALPGAGGVPGGGPGRPLRWTRTCCESPSACSCCGAAGPCSWGPSAAPIPVKQRSNRAVFVEVNKRPGKF